MNELINTPRAADMADRILFPNNGTVMNNFVSGGQTADAVNKMLARNQINATIDHRSFADQGITEQQPSMKATLPRIWKRKDDSRPL